MSKQRKSISRIRKRGGNNFSFVWIWLFTGMFVGISSAVIVYSAIKDEWSLAKLKQLGQEKTAKRNQVIDPTKLRSRPLPKAHKEKQPTPHFEFYTLLPGMEVPLPEQTTIVNNAKEQPKQLKQPNTATPKQKMKDPLKSAQYILQAGVFREMTKADTLKARLVLQGLNTKIQKVKAKDGFWFRVTLGPFPTETQALKQKKQLLSQNIHTTLMLQGQP
jgi:cell division protein FtsN